MAESVTGLVGVPVGDRHGSRHLDVRGELESTACHAPGIQLYLYPTGDIRACCRSFTSLGNVADEGGLLGAWRGMRREGLVERLGANDYSDGCELCGSEVAAEGRAVSFPVAFDHWRERLGAPPRPEWPARIEFNLSTTCNLQCVQCSGDSSSSIRIHREKRPPLAPAYGDDFFEELREFIPHLRAASFAGGEPFLANENFRVWDLVAELAPDLPCTVITNATQWNRRVEAVLERLQIHPIVSIDGATEETYESIRQGARFGEVVANIDRLVAYSKAAGTTMNLNFCLMAGNYHEFPDMLLFAEERGITLNVCVVRSPVQHCLERTSSGELQVALTRLEERSAEMEASLSINLDRWRIELQRVRSWATLPSFEERSPVILMFRRSGSGRVDLDAERTSLSAWAGGAPVHPLVIGADELVRSASSDLCEMLGLGREELEGGPLSTLLRVIERHDVVERTEERYVVDMELDHGPTRMVVCPKRDEDGWADELVALFAFPS